jgi:hypothetical protein
MQHKQKDKNNEKSLEKKTSTKYRAKLPKVLVGGVDNL